ncbi:MAG: alpha-L-rhamnosidase C-terminal domain-containing protein, partial [Xanthobacteraceae bacterium]
GVLDWYERHLDAGGLLGPMPWWNFVDWGYEQTGVPPGGNTGGSTPITLQYAIALREAADLEAALGRGETAARYRGLADRLVGAVRAQTWDEGRGLFADTPERAAFSQQTNTLAILADAVPPDKRQAVMERLLSDASLVQASFYFRFYVDEALRRSGMADRYLQRLEPWRDMLRNGLTATAETPEPSRSDSHAWSAHPNYHLLATVLGIRPAAPGFRSVAIEPALGELKWAEGSIPHPAGMIRVSLRRAGNQGLRATIELPPGVPGEFRWRGQTLPISAPVSVVRCDRTCRTE